MDLKKYFMNCLYISFMFIFVFSTTVAAKSSSKLKKGFSEEELKLYLSQTVDKTMHQIKAVTVNRTNFKQEVLQADQHVLVLFYANLGTTSMKMAAIFAALKQEFNGKVKFCAYKTTEFPFKHYFESTFFRNKYHLDNIPAFSLYRRYGKKIKQFDVLTEGFKNNKEWKLIYKKTRAWLVRALFHSETIPSSQSLIIHY